MHYLMLIQIDEAAFAPHQTAELRAAQARWGRALTEEGILVAADRLRPPQTARTLRCVDGDVMATDGPFVETKEHLGGYYMIDAPDRAAAEARARTMPAGAHCPVFVLPIDGARVFPRAGERPAEQTLLMFYGAPPRQPEHPDLRTWVPLDPAARLAPMTAGTTLGMPPVRVALVDGGLERAEPVADAALAEGGAVELRPVVLLG